jgi:hypothetical protein
MDIPVEQSPPLSERGVVFLVDASCGRCASRDDPSYRAQTAREFARHVTVAIERLLVHLASPSPSFQACDGTSEVPILWGFHIFGASRSSSRTKNSTVKLVPPGAQSVEGFTSALLKAIESIDSENSTKAASVSVAIVETLRNVAWPRPSTLSLSPDAENNATAYSPHLLFVLSRFPTSQTELLEFSCIQGDDQKWCLSATPSLCLDKTLALNADLTRVLHKAAQDNIKVHWVDCNVRRDENPRQVDTSFSVAFKKILLKHEPPVSSTYLYSLLLDRSVRPFSATIMSMGIYDNNARSLVGENVVCSDRNETNHCNDKTMSQLIRSATNDEELGHQPKPCAKYSCNDPLSLSAVTVISENVPLFDSEIALDSLPLPPNVRELNHLETTCRDLKFAISLRCTMPASDLQASGFFSPCKYGTHSILRPSKDFESQISSTCEAISGNSVGEFAGVMIALAQAESVVIGDMYAYCPSSESPLYCFACCIHPSTPSSALVVVLSNTSALDDAIPLAPLPLSMSVVESTSTGKRVSQQLQEGRKRLLPPCDPPGHSSRVFESHLRVLKTPEIRSRRVGAEWHDPLAAQILHLATNSGYSVMTLTDQTRFPWRTKDRDSQGLQELLDNVDCVLSASSISPDISRQDLLQELKKGVNDSKRDCAHENSNSSASDVLDLVCDQNGLAPAKSLDVLPCDNSVELNLAKMPISSPEIMPEKVCLAEPLVSLLEDQESAPQEHAGTSSGKMSSSEIGSGRHNVTMLDCASSASHDNEHRTNNISRTPPLHCGENDAISPALVSNFLAHNAVFPGSQDVRPVPATQQSDHYQAAVSAFGQNPTSQRVEPSAPVESWFVVAFTQLSGSIVNIHEERDLSFDKMSDKIAKLSTLIEFSSDCQSALTVIKSWLKPPHAVCNSVSRSREVYRQRSKDGLENESSLRSLMVAVLHAYSQVVLHVLKHSFSTKTRRAINQPEKATRMVKQAVKVLSGIQAAGQNLDDLTSALLSSLFDFFFSKILVPCPTRAIWHLLVTEIRHQYDRDFETTANAMGEEPGAAEFDVHRPSLSDIRPNSGFNPCNSGLCFDSNEEMTVDVSALEIRSNPQIPSQAEARVRALTASAAAKRIRVVAVSKQQPEHSFRVQLSKTNRTKKSISDQTLVPIGWPCSAPVLRKSPRRRKPSYKLAAMSIVATATQSSNAHTQSEVLPSPDTSFPSLNECSKTPPPTEWAKFAADEMSPE